MAAATILSELDFDQVKSDLKTFLAGQAAFADYDFEGSNMSVILDILAYNTFYNNFYTNMAISEMFLDSSQLRSSVISHTKELNYIPRSYRSSSATINISFSPNDTPASITIPKYTKFTTTIDGKSYTFSTDEVYVVTPNEGDYSVADVTIYEGRIVKEYFDVASGAKYVLSNKQLDTNSIEVVIYDSSAAGADSNTYTYKANLFGVAQTDKVFYLQGAKEEQYEIYFGQDSFGREPTTGEVIEVTYRVATGPNSDGAATFSAASTIEGYTATVTTSGNSEGGAVQETISSIKYFAPKSIQIQDRSVTESDYVNLLKSNFSEIQSVSVYGGERVDPPRYGRVIVSVDIQNSDGISENLKEKYRKFLTDRSPLAINPIIEEPKFVYVVIDSTVHYNTNITSKSANEIESLVRTALTSYSSTYLADFDKNVRHSRLVRAIDDADISIIGNDTEIKMYAYIVPTLSTNSNFTIEFRNKIFIEHPFSIDDDVELNRPGIKSSLFTYNGDLAYLQDNSAGVLQILTNTAAGVFILNDNIGTVDYTTGKVIIRNLNVSAYTGSGIKIYAKPDSQDILGPFDRIISIDDSDITLTVKASTD